MISFRLNRRGTLTFNVSMAVGYFVLSALALHFTRYDGGAAFVWLAGPFLFAGLTITPRHNRVPLALSCIPAMALSSLVFGLGWKAAVPLAIANICEAFAAAWLVRRAYPRFGQFSSAREILWFVALAGIAVPLVVAFVGALLVHLAGPAPYWTTWRDWFTAHAVGVIAFGPPMILLLGGYIKKWVRRVDRIRAIEAWAIMLSVCVVAMVTFGQGKIPLLALPFLPMMWATLRLGRFGAVMSVVILITIASICSLSSVGPTTMIPGGMGLRLQILQAYFATVVMVILPTAGALKSRGRLYERLRAAEAINRLMLDHSSDIILRLSRDGSIQYVSPAVRRYQGAAPANLVGRQFETLLQERDRDRVMAVHHSAMAAPHDIFPVEWQTIGATQSPRSFEAHAKAMLNEQGSPTGVVYVLRDVTERNLRAVELEVRANTHPLTGLLNRRVFDQALDLAIAAADENEACVAIFDLDHFKAVNDSHGHLVGDQVLTHFAAILKSCTRESDVAARLGGEEFAVIFHASNRDQAQQICERIRRETAAARITADVDAVMAVTVSVGLKQVQPGMNADALLNGADRALYAAKHAGRNQISFAA